MRHLLKFILKILAKRVIARYQPTVIGITGSVGKSTAKEAIYAVLSRRFWTRKNEENYNNEFGVPMAVLGISPKQPISDFRSPISNKFCWFLWLASGLWLAYGWPKQKYPKMLVLELAADRPGDIQYLVNIVRPQVGVITAVGDVPVHVEFYAGPQEVAEEKSKLIAQLPVGGLAVLNYDDQTVLDMKEESKAKIMTFGFTKEADVWVSDIAYFVADNQQPTIGGLSFKLGHVGSFVPVRVNGLAGTHQIYGLIAAVAVGLHFNMNLIEISGSFENVELPHHRMNLIRGIKNSVIIDDTYNASPLSMHAALDTLRDFAKARTELGGTGRRIAVLGDMRELGKYEIEAHQAVGNLATERCDILITVGSAAKFIADSAANQIVKESVFSFSTSEEAKGKLQEIIKEGDVILVKGSRAMEMEKIIDEIENTG